MLYDAETGYIPSIGKWMGVEVQFLGWVPIGVIIAEICCMDMSDRRSVFPPSLP